MKQQVVTMAFACVLVSTAFSGCAQTASPGFSAGPARSASETAPAGSITDPERIRWAQRALQAAGFNPGAIDGTHTPETVDAVRQFQQARRLPATGYVNTPTEEALATATGVARPGGKTN
jgi:peptidoglycan hydrolase-like protein with peptidoglycan-binding domain